jgi:uncharacterized protein YbjT (DUF2867 family)
MIFLTGGTGTVGSRLVPLLLQRGVEVRCLVHSTDLDRSATSGIDLVRADFDQPDTYASALRGCDRLFLLTPAHPKQATREIALLDAARSAGVTHVVRLSVVGAHRESPVNFARGHAEVDDHLIASGLGYSILRPSGFMQVHLLPQTAASEGRWYGMTGDGAHPFIDALDVAGVAAELLAAPRQDSAIYEITGPAAISMPEAAAALGRVLLREVQYVDLPGEQLSGALTGAGLPAYVVEGVVEFYAGIRAGHAATTTHTAEQILGRQPIGYEEFLGRDLLTVTE